MWIYWSYTFVIFISRLAINHCDTKIDLKGLPQNDPSLIDAIKKEFLIEPDISKPYNLANDLTLSKAQFGQDDAVLELFKGKQNGFFIEAGAYDGETYSNSLRFELHLNWTGVLVEPNPDNFDSLLTKNRRAYAIKTCLSPKPEVTEVSFDAAGKEMEFGLNWPNLVFFDPIFPSVVCSLICQIRSHLVPVVPI